MKANESKDKPWLSGEHGSIEAMAAMLVELDRTNLLPSEMRHALTVHAEALLDTLPGFVEETSKLLAQTLAFDSGFEGHKAAQVSWSIAFMSDTIAGMQHLARLESEREKYPEIYAAIRKSSGGNIKLATSQGNDQTH